MKELLILPILFAAVFGLVYLLYRNGIGVINSKAALMYQGYPRVGRNRNRIKAKFISCRGTTKRVICLRPERMYRFVFSSAVTKGTVWIEISDKESEHPLVLDQQHPCANISVRRGGRLFVTTRFTQADGEYELSWDLLE